MRHDPKGTVAHIKVTIEYYDGNGSSVQTATFEDSSDRRDEKRGYFQLNPAWAIRWALGMLEYGNDMHVVTTLLEAAAECEPDFKEYDEIFAGNKAVLEEQQLLLKALQAVDEWKNFADDRVRKIVAKKESKGGVK